MTDKPEDTQDNPLEFVTTDDLLEEVKRRCAAGIFVVAYANEQGELFRGHSWGSIFWRRGVAESLATQFADMCESMVTNERRDDD